MQSLASAQAHELYLHKVEATKWQMSGDAQSDVAHGDNLGLHPLAIDDVANSILDENALSPSVNEGNISAMTAVTQASVDQSYSCIVTTQQVQIGQESKSHHSRY
jgi:hypothetical protein